MSYDGDFEADLLEQYRLFVDTEERLVTRRQEENRFFLSINALVITVISVLLRQGITDREASVGIVLLAIAGVALAVSWRRIIRSYQLLNTAKFRVIDQFEERLPMRMFAAEWEEATALGYQPFTSIERLVPLIFGGLHGCAFLVGVLGVLGVVSSG